MVLFMWSGMVTASVDAEPAAVSGYEIIDLTAEGISSEVATSVRGCYADGNGLSWPAACSHDSKAATWDASVAHWKLKRSRASGGARFQPSATKFARPSAPYASVE